jgi:hypothetical protein
MESESIDPLKRIKQLTSPLGIYQHTKYDRIDPVHGFALEDQARALLVAHTFNNQELCGIYLDFIAKAKRKDGLLHQFYYEKKGGHEDNSSSEKTISAQEAYAMTLWALYKTGNYKKEDFAPIVKSISENALTWNSPRAMSEALIGLTVEEKASPLEKTLFEKLVDLFEKNATKDWPWFENILTYANAIFPWAMWEVFLKRKDKKAFEIAQRTTDFLLETSKVNNIPAPIGCNGWYPKGGEKALYDQQPIDPAYMVCCLEKAYKATKDPKYLKEAAMWWSWFFGNNLKKACMVTEDFACYDGLTSYGVNLNRGAESNICFLFAYISAIKLDIVEEKVSQSNPETL